MSTPTPLLQPWFYSDLSAFAGSNDAARYAGIQQASTVITTNSNKIAAYVVRSVGPTPTSIDRITRVSANAAPSPITRPSPLNFIPSPITSPKMLRLVAPYVIRTPISAVRCRTAVDSTPQSPTQARIAATAA